jgi:hypothetical protein
MRWWMQWLMVGRGGAVRRRRQARGGWRGSKGTDTREKTKKLGEQGMGEMILAILFVCALAPGW